MAPPRPLENDFARFAGELAESLSFNKSIGQIYGLLYLANEAMALQDIAKRLAMSKGNASINLRALEAWGAVRRVSVSGSRQDHYEANRNVRDLALRRVREGLSRRLDLAEDRLKTLFERLEGEDPGAKKRLQELGALVSQSRKALNLLPKVLSFLGR